MTIKRVYFAGGLRGSWRDDLAALLPEYEVLDPRAWQVDGPASYTAKDLEAIRMADIIIALMDSSNPSGFGLSIEIGYARALGKPVAFIDEIHSDWRSRYFDMHRCMATFVCRNFSEAAKWANTYA
jgi:nucleoside 2-deoxyribosyltransferase